MSLTVTLSRSAFARACAPAKGTNKANTNPKRSSLRFMGHLPNSRRIRLYQPGNHRCPGGPAPLEPALAEFTRLRSSGGTRALDSKRGLCPQRRGSMLVMSHYGGGKGREVASGGDLSVLNHPAGVTAKSAWPLCGAKSKRRRCKSVG